MANTTRFTFEEHGFLSDMVMGWSIKTASAHTELFALVTDVNREAMKRMLLAAPNKNDSQQLIGALMFGRMLQSAQACFILAARGMAADARTLVRSATETAIAIQAVAQSETFFDELVGDHERHTQTVANVFVNDKQISSELSSQDESGLREVIATIKDKYKSEENESGKPPGFNWGAIATRVGMSAIYNTVYREMSADGVHVSITSLNRHVRADHNNEIKGLSFEPSDRGLVSTLCAMVTAMIFAMDALEKVFGAETESKELGEFARRLKPIELSIPAEVEATAPNESP